MGPGGSPALFVAWPTERGYTPSKAAEHVGCTPSRSAGPETVEVLRHSVEGAEQVAIFGPGRVVRSELWLALR